MIIDVAINAASGIWTVASKPSIVGVLVPVARDALLPAVVAFCIAWLGMRATFSTTTMAELFADLAMLLVKVAIIMAALLNWPSVSKTVLDAGEAIVTRISPGSSSYGLVGNIMSYVTTVSDIQANHSLHTFTKLIEGVFTEDLPTGCENSVLALEIGGGLCNNTGEALPLPTEGAQFMQIGMALMTTLGYAVLSMILAVMVLCGCLIPMIMFTVAMVLGPIVLPAYLLDNQFTRELTEGWQDVLISSMVALMVIAVLVAIILPMVPMPSATYGTGAVDAQARAAQGFQTLLFAAALLSMPQQIAHGLLNGRTPSPPSIFGFVLAVLKLFPKTRLLATALGRKK